jgi:hypothetical protein
MEKIFLQAFRKIKKALFLGLCRGFDIAGLPKDLWC